MADPIRMTCPCGKGLTAPASALGRKGKCPVCGARFIIHPDNNPLNEATLVMESSDLDDTRIMPPPFRQTYPSQSGISQQRGPLPIHEAIQQVVVVQNQSMGIGHASIILGSIALITFWAACISIPLGFIGLVLGIVGCVSAHKKNDSNFGLEIAGTVISAVALILSIMLSIAMQGLFLGMQ